MQRTKSPLRDKKAREESSASEEAKPNVERCDLVSLKKVFFFRCMRSES